MENDIDTFEVSNLKTLDYDITNARETFHSEKYRFIERVNRHEFFTKIRSCDFTTLDEQNSVSQNKNKLVEIKKENKEIKEEIKSLCVSIHVFKKEFNENKIKLEEMRKSLNEKEIMFKNAEWENKEQVEAQQFVAKWKYTCEELQECLKKLEIKKNELKSIDVEVIREEVNKLKNRKNELMEKERVSAGDFIIDDLFSWYSNGAVVLEKFCGFKIVKTFFNNQNLHIILSCRDVQIEIVIKEGKFIEAKTTEGIEDFDKIKEYALKIDDVRYLLIMIMRKIKLKEDDEFPK